MVTQETLQAVILTGARDVHNPLLEGTGLQSKVLLPVGGKPMVLSVLEAVAASRYAPKLYVSSNDPQILSLNTTIPYEGLPSEDRAVRSLLKSLERLPGEEWVLFVSGDHPLLTSEMVDYFVEEVMARDLAFGVAVVDRAVVNRHYPQSRRTYFPVKNGAYSGANMFLINKRTFQGSANFMETIDRNRKKPWKSVLMLNPISMIRILLRQLDIHEVAREACKAFRCKAGIVEMPFAEACMDVDKPSDRELAEIILRKRRLRDLNSEHEPQPRIRA